MSKLHIFFFLISGVKQKLCSPLSWIYYFLQMAICVVVLTKNQRTKLAVTFRILSLILSLMGLLIIILSYVICIRVAPNLYSEKSEVSFVFTMTGTYGGHVLFENLVGVKICHKCYHQAHKKSTNKLWLIWSIVGIYLIFNILLIARLIVRISKHIVRLMRHSFEKGMRTYLKDSNWKLTIDALQFKLKCCGINSYKDWHEIVWIDESYVKENDESVTELRFSKSNFNLPVIPWSCCRVDFPLQCFHDPLQQKQSAYLWKEQQSTVLESINTQGCLEILRKPIEFALAAFVVIIVIVLLLQVVSIVLSRILYTSCRNAIILNNEEDASPGWIFGRGDFGWSRGEGLQEIMKNYNEVQCRNTSSPKSGSKSRSKSSAKISFRLPSSSKSSKKSQSSTPKSKSSVTTNSTNDSLMV